MKSCPWKVTRAASDAFFSERSNICCPSSILAGESCTTNLRCGNASTSAITASLVDLPTSTTTPSSRMPRRNQRSGDAVPWCRYFVRCACMPRTRPSCLGCARDGQEWKVGVERALERCLVRLSRVGSPFHGSSRYTLGYRCRATIHLGGVGVDDGAAGQKC
jgi:hypothetical protein